MQENNKSKQIQLGSMEDTLDTMFFGQPTPQKARMFDALEKRKARRGGMKNQAK